MRLPYKELFRHALGRRGVYVDRGRKRGYLRLNDIRAARRGTSFQTIFDVGANFGQSALEYLAAFESATVWCFEPGPQAHAVLEKSFRDQPRVRLVQAALGASIGAASFVETEATDFSYIVRGQDGDGDRMGGRQIELRIDTLDNYCTNQNVKVIDFLKIDTEGFDLEVLKGAEGLLGDRRIDFIQAEVGMSKQNKQHVHFSEVASYVLQYGYDFFGLYDQIPLSGSDGELERADIIFRRLA